MTGTAHVAAIVVTSSTPLWYTTRATGFVALVLLTASMALGLLSAVRFYRPAWPRFVTLGLHRNVSLLALTFTVVHVLTTVLDSFVSIPLPDAFIPFISSYRPFWLGLGAISFDCFAQRRQVHLETSIDQNAVWLTQSQQMRGLA